MKTCFVISPIGPDESEIRHRSDLTLRHIVTPACQELEYVALRADKISDPGIITSQVIMYIISAEMVVADLTGHNPNVFYELAIRHTLRRPVVQIMSKGEMLPFDVAQSRTIYVDLSDPDSVVASREELVRQMQIAADKATPIDSPVSMAVEMDVLRASDNPIEKSNFEILESIRDLKRLMMDMRDGQLKRQTTPLSQTVTVLVQDLKCNVVGSFWSFQSFLDRCYTQFMHEWVDPHTYGESWILIDVLSDKLLEKLTVDHDGRTLEEVGICDGCILKVRFLVTQRDS